MKQFELNALWRPGAIHEGIVDLYLDRRHGRQQTAFRHPLLKEVLESTYGIPIYQEQLMQIAASLAGYTASEADELRRAMGTLKPEVLAPHKERFVAGAAERHAITAGEAEKIFDELVHFAKHAFIKAHSASYALIAYQTAWFKVHYPAEFLAAAGVDSDHWG